jgi:hypothetical protein
LSQFQSKREKKIFPSTHRKRERGRKCHFQIFFQCAKNNKSKLFQKKNIAFVLLVRMQVKQHRSLKEKPKMEMRYFKTFFANVLSEWISEREDLPD